MAAAKVASPHLLAAEEHRGLRIESHARQAGLLAGHHIGAGVLLGQDLDTGIEHFLVSAGVVAVLVGVEHVFDGLVSDGFDFRHDIRVVALEFVVDHNHAFIRDVNGHVSAVPDDGVEVIFHFLDSESGGGSLRGLGTRHPGTCGDDGGEAQKSY